MNAVRTMKNISTIQFVIASISTLVFLPPSLYAFYDIFSLVLNETVLSLAIDMMLFGIMFLLGPIIGVWWYGIQMLIGYYNISKGKYEISETRAFWNTSLVCNVFGLMILGFFAVAMHAEHPEFSLAIPPALTGSILAFIALRIPAENSQILEPQIS
jgi:hypothetical protein